MTYYLFITGCYQNYHDAQNIAHLLEKMGYVLDDEKKANLIVILACSVRQKPIDRIFGKIKNWRKLPQKPKIIITGCVLPKDKKKITEKVEAIINIKEIAKKLPIILGKKINENFRSQTECLPFDITSDTGLVPIMYGCNNFCSYCAVPYTRGQERSRDEKEIIMDIKKELKSDKKKILLLGQNVNSYQLSVHSLQLSVHGYQKKPKTENQRQKTSFIPFVSLLKKIDKIPGNFSFNFTSSNPHDFHESLVNTLPKLKKWERILQLPLQSGDDVILRKMNRKYTSVQYLRLISKLKAQMSNLKISTDIIVGFPTETKKQFQNTVDLCKKIGFDKVYVAQYSPRPGTLANKKYKDNILQAEKKRRWQIINDLINKYK